MDRAFDELMKQVSSSLPVKVQMNFQFFYKNREICNRTRSVATQSSDEFSIFLQKSRDLQQNTFAFIHSHWRLCTGNQKD